MKKLKKVGSLAAVMFVSPAVLCAQTLIDDFTTDGAVIRAGGSSALHYVETSVLGGAREMQAREAWSKHWVYNEVGGGTAAFYAATPGPSACDLSLQYGTAIGTVGQRNGVNFPDGDSPNYGKGTELNLALTLDSEFLIDIAQLAFDVWVDDGAPRSNIEVGVFSGAAPGPYRGGMQFTETGVGAVALSDFTDQWGNPITEAVAADIDGVYLRSTFCGREGLSQATIINSFAVGAGNSDAIALEKCEVELGGAVDEDGYCVVTTTEVSPYSEVLRASGRSGRGWTETGEDTTTTVKMYDRSGAGWEEEPFFDESETVRDVQACYNPGGRNMGTLGQCGM